MADNISAPAPSGVGGWLKVLVLALTVLTPVFAVGVSVWSTLVLLKLKGFSMAVPVLDAVFLAGGWFAYAAGRDLKALKAGAPKKARFFFELLIAIAGLAAAYGLNLYFFSGVGNVVVLQAVEVSVAIVLFSVVWHNYLSSSARVRNTYR